MQPTVLAGPIQFSPADIALILTVLAAAALLVTSPGWLLLAIVFGRRPGPAVEGGNRQSRRQPDKFLSRIDLHPATASRDWGTPSG